MESKKRILIVEDDASLGKSLLLRLSQEYEVDWAINFHEATQKLKKHPWDLILLDINLPDGDGLNLARNLDQFYKKSLRPSFLFLSARNDAETRLQGFELGADEFIPKPFHLKELMLRVQHVLASHISHNHEIVTPQAVINFNDLSVRKGSGGIEYPSATDMKILKFLIEKSPKPASRDEIITHVWGLESESNHRTVDNAIVRLRQILGSSGESMIRSIRSVGYQWRPEGGSDEE
jgi:two-component system phosphate regulon response regulator PhoB